MTMKVALITGGAKGIGRGIALDLASQQWHIALCYRTSEAEANDTAAAIIGRAARPRRSAVTYQTPSRPKKWSPWLKSNGVTSMH